VPELHPLELPADWNGAVQSSEQARNVLGDHMQASSAAVGVVAARYGSRFAALESFRCKARDPKPERPPGGR